MIAILNVVDVTFLEEDWLVKLICKLFGYKYSIVDKDYCGYCLVGRCLSYESFFTENILTAQALTSQRRLSLKKGLIIMWIESIKKLQLDNKITGVCKT